MGKIANMTFIGKSGAKYEFEVWSRDTTFNDVGGVYIFSNRNSQTRRHTVLYVGQTNSFKDRRLQHHEQWECAEPRGGNVICTYRESSSVERQRIERDLINYYNPPCNNR